MVKKKIRKKTIRRAAKKAPIKELKPVISVKINNSTPLDELTEDERPEEKAAKKPLEETSSYVIYVIIGAVIVMALGVGFLVMQARSVPVNNGNYTFPMLTNNTMVCNDTIICFLNNGTWYNPGYTTGVSLSAANNYKASNEAEISQFFKNDNVHNISLVFGSVSGSDQNNAQLITTAAPFTFYLSMYFPYEGINKTFIPYLLSEYNLTNPAVIILGPGTGANETSLKFDGKNVIAQADTYENLKIVLGKLLILAIKGK